MATLTIRNLDDDLVAALKERARRNHRSLEAELRSLLRDVVGERSPASLRELADQIAALTPDVAQTDSTALIREDRHR
jgi:plasmid stability protein